MNWQPIIEQIEAATGNAFKLVSAHALAGGDINSAFCLQGAHCAYFVKLNRADTTEMFAAEALGLTELASTRAVRVPAPVVTGNTSDQAFLVLEYIEFGTPTAASQRLLGEQLARLHQIRQPYFGWSRDNTIGNTPQPNPQSQNWLEFWQTQRLQHQLKLAAARSYCGALQSLGEQLYNHLADFFQSYQPKPSLLHGDLWSGNAATDRQGNPVIFDPACYYGDREADLAMTELFGGFSQDFYTAYRNIYPLDPGYSTRKKLYNLYHILNHLNLFGSGYLSQSESMIKALLSEIR